MATIREIAEQAGVSIGTVDRVLHNRGKVDPVKEKRIRAIIKELNYTPNLYARQLKLSKRFQFGVLIPQPHQDGHYWTLPKKGIDDAIAELNAQKISVQYFHFDKTRASSFQRQADLLLESDVDGFILAPQFTDCCESFIRRIQNRIPGIFIDSPLLHVKPLSFIGQDAYQSGVLSAKLMQGLIHGKADVAVIRPKPQDLHIEQRVNGFLSFFENHNEITTHIFDVLCCEDEDDFQDITIQIINSLNQLEGIFVPNARTYHIAEKVVELGLQNDIQIIGYDLVPENLKYLELDVIDYLISQTPRQQGYRAVYALYRYLVLREPVAAEIMMPIDIVTKENVTYYSG